MSKFLGVVFACFVIYFCTSSCEDHGLIDWFSKKEIIENWVRVKGGWGCFSPQLDRKWVCSTIFGLSVEVKIREPLEKSDKYDLAIRVKGTFTEPRLKNEQSSDTVESYKVSFNCRFYDKDGFEIYYFNPFWCHGIKHEKHNDTLEWDSKFNNGSFKVVSETLYQNVIPENIAKRICRISYFPDLTPVIKSKVDETLLESDNDTKKSPFHLFHKEKMEASKDIFDDLDIEYITG